MIFQCRYLRPERTACGIGKTATGDSYVLIRSTQRAASSTSAAEVVQRLLLVRNRSCGSRVGLVLLLQFFARRLARGLATPFATALFATVFFAAGCLSALCARALPAGERLVAGLRVDFTTRFRTDVAFDPGLDEREGSLFCVFTLGLLMLKRSTYPLKRRAKIRRSLA